ncbi:hypothetical protein [Massilia sp. CF038]|uniref:hypothetical protein n=1 Tax=Massilia sp. CF038 TaxID=1881045 RepID=UPI000920503A|nr:hypothetical protein [Massilia sp. CF038]SHH53794.1 hypothetical protein SAMN05428948_4353 [Massilia sp. CF038]
MTIPSYHHITAKIRMLTPERGGRASPIPGGEFTGILAARGQQFSFRCRMPEGGLAPGVTATVDIEFMFPELALPFFKVLNEFTLWEGVTIGHGRVVKLPEA